MLTRRIRGLLSTIAGGALTGAMAGLALALLFLLVPGPKTITVTPGFSGAIILFPVIWGAIVGALGGGTFGTLLMFAERGRGIDDADVISELGAVARDAQLTFGHSLSPSSLGGPTRRAGASSSASSTRC